MRDTLLDISIFFNALPSDNTLPSINVRESLSLSGIFRIADATSFERFAYLKNSTVLRLFLRLADGPWILFSNRLAFGVTHRLPLQELEMKTNDELGMECAIHLAKHTTKSLSNLSLLTLLVRRH